MSGKFYSVGVGPGDPELVTLKAIKTIENSDLIVVPDSGAKNNVAQMCIRDRFPTSLFKRVSLISSRELKRFIFGLILLGI